MPVILWTDALVYILLATVIWMIVYISKRDYMFKQWRKAYADPIRMVCFVILLSYCAIGLLDSMHYRTKHDAQVYSVLDWILRPHPSQVEVTYSAPFATKAFTKQMIYLEDGQVDWVRPDLTYAHAIDIPFAVMFGFAQGLLIWLCISMLYWLVVIKYYKKLFSATTPWRTGWITFGIICILTTMCMNLWNNYHILGTDKVGVDVFYSAIKSIRTGLIIGILTTFITLPFAIIFGAAAGYFRGWVDDVVQYIYSTLSSIPSVLLIAAAVLSLEVVLERHAGIFQLTAQRTDMRLVLLCAILGLTSWTSLCRIVRGETLKMRHMDFVLAAKALGANSWQIIFRHVVPNLMHIILISLVLDFSGLVLAEAVLSYVGVGVDPSTYSWGNMINSARMELGRDPIIWWSLTGAFILMFTLVLAANIFADGVRDAFDPKV